METNVVRALYKKNIYVGIFILLILAAMVSSGDYIQSNQEYKKCNNLFFSGGSGTASDPYQISNVTELQNVRENLGAHYMLINDIDANETKDWDGGKGFDSLGEYPEFPNFGKSFTGSFNGNDYKIINLVINRSDSDYVGLFGHIHANSVIQDVLLCNINIYGNNYVGGLIGYNDGDMNNCFSTGKTKGNCNVGGLSGLNNGFISNVSSSCNVSGHENIGGLIGENNGI
ncbi:MAG: hypothetical protein GF329_05415, partial [Candidatus Lokiarchaeota archaeon]|nr:hypothetical protein [Candidatus Lokiarchaeota archaeon]